MAVRPRNIRPNLAGDSPEIHASAVIDPSAQIIGNVKIGRNVYVGPMAVIRADELKSGGDVTPIIIEEGVVIQDGAIIHSHGNALVTIGPRTTVAHGAVVHGPCSIGKECLLAIRSSLYHATLESNVWLGMGAMVMHAKVATHIHVPAGSIIRSSADTWGLRLVSPKEKKIMQDALKTSYRLREDYLKMHGEIPVG